MTSLEFTDYMGQSETTHLAVLRMLMSTVPVGVWYTNTHGEVLYVSEAWQKITGVAAAEVVGEGYRKLIHPDDLPRVTAAMTQKISNPACDYEVEFRLRTKSGDYKWMYSKAVNMAAHNGYPEGLVGITIDVDLRHAASAEARMLWRAVEAAANPIIITAHHPDKDERSPVTYVNVAFERLTGYTLDELRGKDPRFLHGADRDQPALEQIRDAIKAERAISGVYVRNYKKSGEMYIAELNLSPIYSGCELTHWVGVQSLATEQVRLKEMEELKAAIHQLAQSNSMLRGKE